METLDRSEAERRYRVLLRSLARGERAPGDLDLILSALRRRREDLEADLEAWRQRQRLAAWADQATDLGERLAIAHEGYLLVRQSARRAREEAEERERRARATYDALARRAEEARAADEALKALVSPELRERWERAETERHQRRDALRDARLSGRNAEHLEADLEEAERRLEAIRTEALEP